MSKATNVTRCHVPVPSVQLRNVRNITDLAAPAGALAGWSNLVSGDIHSHYPTTGKGNFYPSMNLHKPARSHTTETCPGKLPPPTVTNSSLWTDVCRIQCGPRSIHASRTPPGRENSSAHDEDNELITNHCRNYPRPFAGTGVGLGSQRRVPIACFGKLDTCANSSLRPRYPWSLIVAIIQASRSHVFKKPSPVFLLQGIHQPKPPPIVSGQC